MAFASLVRPAKYHRRFEHLEHGLLSSGCPKSDNTSNLILHCIHISAQMRIVYTLLIAGQRHVMRRIVHMSLVVDPLYMFVSETMTLN